MKTMKLRMLALLMCMLMICTTVMPDSVSAAELLNAVGYDSCEDDGHDHCEDSDCEDISCEDEWEVEEYHVHADSDEAVVRIAIFDTGINGAFIAGGKSFVDYTDSWEDDNGHGTAMAETLTDALTVDAEIYAVKVLDSNGIGTHDDIVEAIAWAVENEMDIVALSFAGKDSTAGLDAAIAYAYENDILVIAAAGNDGSNSAAFPAAYAEAVSVGATIEDGTVSNGTNYGKYVDVYALGTYGEQGGTSVAVQMIVAQAAAMLDADNEMSVLDLRQEIAGAEKKTEPECEYVSEGVVEATACAHQGYVYKDTSPTCTSTGTKIIKCKKCGATLSTTTKAKLGHNYTTIVRQTPATCTTNGTTTKKCSRCTATNTYSGEPKALGHNYVTVTDTAPTCTTAGKAVKKCSRCGVVASSSSIAALGHNYTVIVKQTPATCTTAGTTTKKCSRCSSTNTYAGTSAALGHDFTVAVPEECTPPSCAKNGTQVSKCSRCEERSTKSIPKIDHNYIYGKVDPTYTAEGYTYKECSECKLFSKIEILDKLELELNISAETLSFDAISSTKSITVTCNAGNEYWHAYESCGWLEATKNGSTLSITVDANTTPTSRKAVISIAANDLTRTLVVTQAENSLTLSSHALGYGISGGVQSVTVACAAGSTNWSYETPGCQWMTVTKTSASTLSILVGTNSTDVIRTATIIVRSSEDITKTISVSQSPNVVTLSSSTWNIDAASCSNSFSVTSVSEDWSVKSSNSWLSTQKSGNNLIVTAEANLNSSARVGYVVLSNAYAAECKLTVTQGANSLSLSKKGVGFTAVKGYDTIEVTCAAGNENWTIDAPALPWLNAYASDGELVISVLNNNTADLRLATVLVKSGDITQSVSVSQSPNVLEISETSWNPTSAANTKDFIVYSPLDFDIVKDEDVEWLRADKTGNVVSLTVEEYDTDPKNPSEEPRTATVTIIAKINDAIEGSTAASKTIVVSQEPIRTIPLEVFPATGGEYSKRTVNLQELCDFVQCGVELAEGCDWLTLSQSGTSLTLTVEHNTGRMERNTAVYVKSGSQRAKLIVRQYPLDLFVNGVCYNSDNYLEWCDGIRYKFAGCGCLIDSECEGIGDGNTLTIKAENNWTISCSGFIKVLDSPDGNAISGGGVGSKEVYVTVEQNASNEARFGTITITSDTGTMYRISVAQNLLIYDESYANVLGKLKSLPIIIQYDNNGVLVPYTYYVNGSYYKVWTGYDHKVYAPEDLKYDLSNEKCDCKTYKAGLTVYTIEQDNRSGKVVVTDQMYPRYAPTVTVNLDIQYKELGNQLFYSMYSPEAPGEPDLISDALIPIKEMEHTISSYETEYSFVDGVINFLDLCESYVSVIDFVQTPLIETASDFVVDKVLDIYIDQYSSSIMEVIDYAAEQSGVDVNEQMETFVDQLTSSMFSEFIAANPEIDLDALFEVHSVEGESGDTEAFTFSEYGKNVLKDMLKSGVKDVAVYLDDLERKNLYGDCTDVGVLSAKGDYLSYNLLSIGDDSLLFYDANCNQVDVAIEDVCIAILTVS